MAWLELILLNPGFFVMMIGTATVLNRRRIAAQAGLPFGGESAVAHPTPTRHVAVFGLALIALGLALFVYLLAE